MVDITSVFWLVNFGVQILFREIRIFGVQSVNMFEIGSTCHPVDDTFQDLRHSGYWYLQDWFMG